MAKFDPGRFGRAMEVRSLTVRALAQAARISPTTVQVARHGGHVSLRSQRAILAALEAIPELPGLELLAAPAVPGNGVRHADAGRREEVTLAAPTP